MAGDFGVLAAKWATLAAAPTVVKLAALNATNVAGPPQDIAADRIENFLVTTNKIVALRAFVYQTPATPNAQALLAANYLIAILQGADGGLIRAGSEPGLLGILSHLSDDARTGITAANVTALINACSPPMPWWQANGFTSPVALSDLIAAGNLF